MTDFANLLTMFTDTRVAEIASEARKAALDPTLTAASRQRTLAQALAEAQMLVTAIEGEMTSTGPNERGDDHLWR